MKKFTSFLIVAFVASMVLGSSAFGQILQRGFATNANTATTALSVNRPSAVALNDVMILNIAQVGNAATNATVPSGWILISGADLLGTTDRRMMVYYKIATAGEPTSYSITLGAGVTSASASIVAFYNVNTTGGFLVGGGPGGPFDVAPGSINVSNSSTVSATGLTTATAGAAVIMLGGTSNAAPTYTGWAATSPATLNEIYDNQSTNTSVGAAWNTKAAAGATGTATATISSSDRNGGLLLALRPAVSAVLTPTATQYIAVGGSVNFTATAYLYAGSGNYNYTWTAVGATIPGSNPNSIVGSADSKTLVFPTAGSFTVTVSVARTGETTHITNTVRVNVAAAPAGANMWATSSDGTQISSFNVNGGVYFSGPTNIFAATFPGTTTGGTSTAALGRSDKPSQPSGFFYWLPNTTANLGVVEVFGATAAGGTPTRIGSIDMNTSGVGTLGFVRLAAGPDGTCWILASDGTTLYLAKFKPNGVTINTSLPPADQLVIVDASVTLVGGSVATFQNGDICLDNNGNIVALANSGGTTQIFTGFPTGATTTLTKKFDLYDENSVPFTGSVNGIAFDLTGSLYVSASDGLYYINQTTVNGPSAAISINQVWVGTGLQDLASNFFPTTIVTPVKMGDFTVTKAGVNANLNWNTLTELNSDHFEVERSIDGVNFTVVGSVQAAGSSNSNINYQFSDPLPSLTGIVYYRLRTVDIDAKASFSKIVPLRLSGSTIKDFTVYPNPFNNNLKVLIRSEKETEVTIRINNAIGQAVVSRKAQLQRGDNVIVLTSELEALEAGMHIVEIITEEGKLTQKVIKR